METTTREQIKKIANELNRPCLIPVETTIEGYQDPARLYLALRQLSKPSYLLESADAPGEAARYSVIGTEPLLHVKVKGKDCQITGRSDIVTLSRDNVDKSRKEDALDILQSAMLFDKIDVPKMTLRYVHGLAGYISYDYVRSQVDIGDNTIDDMGHPDLEFIFPSKMIVFDRMSNATNYRSAFMLLENGDLDVEYDRARAKLEEIVKVKGIEPENKQLKNISIRSNISKDDFKKKVERTKEYIRTGDAIQVVLSRRIELDPCPPLGQFYMNLREINPSPYMFFLDFPERSIVGLSPEIMVKVKGREIITRPIAGTRKRGENAEEDAAMEKELLSDEKERAEHIMLVDLGRNDVGRVSKFGSIKVTDFMSIEKYSHVQHIVTNISGELQDGKDTFDAFRATFPAGTVSGAPKVRAMEIIEELEPTRRGIYAGSVGSLEFQGDADFAITIRTLVAERGKGYVQVGAGIVADSDPEKEYYETENKARALLRAAGV